MAHEFESGFFVAKGAWHGLGTTLLTPKLRDYHRTSTADYRRRSSWRNSLRSQLKNLSRSLEIRLYLVPVTVESRIQGRYKKQ